MVMYLEVKQLDEWEIQREIVVACLYSLAQHLNDYYHKSNKVGIAATAVGVGGTAIGIAGALMAPFTGGASLLPATAVAGGSAAVGIVSSGVKKIANKRKEKNVFKSVDELLDKDQKSSKEIQELAERLDEVEESLKKFLLVLVVCDTEEDVEGAVVPYHPPTSGQMTSPQPCYTTCSMPESKSQMDQLIQLKSILQQKVPHLVKGMQCSGLMRQMINAGKAFVKDGAKVGKSSMKAVQIGKVAKIGGLVVCVVLLPIEVKELIKQAKDIKDKRNHPSSKEIQDQAEKLMEGIKKIRKELLEKVSAFNNLVLLINFIKRNGVPEILDTFLNQILKILLPLKDILKAFDRLEVDGCDDVRYSVEEEMSGMLINYTGVEDSLLKELAVTIWTVWKLSSKSFAFLQNTSFMTIPAVWTLFGVSTDSFCSGSGQGVSILLPLDFDGDIVSQHEYKGSSEDWNGRCIILNVISRGSKYSLVNVLAPEGQQDRSLFLQEIVRFINRFADGELIMATNIQTEIQHMTVLCKKRQVCQNVPWSIMIKFIPYRTIAEYLVNFHGFKADEPGTKVYAVCRDFTVGDPNEVFINWAGCDKPVLSTGDCRKQLQPILSLGLTDLWRTRNPGIVEFSSHAVISHNVVTCSKSAEFFVSKQVEHQCGQCFIDHDLRFLGFLKESVLMFGKNKDVHG